MTKEQLQQELLEKVKPGTKPSQLKKSKSADNLSLPSQSTSLTRSKSAEVFTDPKYPYTSLISQQQTIEKLEKETQTKSTTIALLRKKVEELEQHPPTLLLEEQLKVKQRELEGLRKDLEETNSKLSQTKQELDKSLQARHQGLKDWNQVYQKAQALDSELNNTVEESAEELTTQDQRLTNLRSENFKLKQTNQSLQRDLTLAQKLAELRQNNPFKADNFNSLNYFKYAVYALLAIWFLLMLRRDYV